MTAQLADAKGRYAARFIAELSRRTEAILEAAAMLRTWGLQTLPEEGTEGADDYIHAVDVIYRHAHSIRGAAGTLGIEPARETADIIAEVALHLNEPQLLGDAVAWELIEAGTHGLAAYGESARDTGEPDAAALAVLVEELRNKFERRFAPPTDAVDDFAEVARVLRLSDEEIAAFRFPTRADGAAAEAAGHAPRMPEQAAVDHGELEDTFTPIEQAAVESQVLPETQDAGSGVEAGIPASPFDVEVGEPLPEAILAAEYREVEPDVSAAETYESGPVQLTAPPAAGVPAASPVVSRRTTIFCQSSLEMLRHGQPALDALDENRWELSRMRTLRRIFHTIKGDGRQAGFPQLARLSEAAEDVFDAVFDHREAHPAEEVGVPVDAVPLLNKAHGALADMLEDPATISDDRAAEHESLVMDLIAVAGQVPRTLPAVATDAASVDILERRQSGEQGPRRQVYSAEERRRRLLPTFLTEARGIDNRLHGCILALQEDALSIDALLGATRALHTLKGNAASMQLEQLVALADAGETLLERLAISGEPVSAHHYGLLNDLDGAIRHTIDAIDHGDPIDAAALKPLIDALTVPVMAPAAQEAQQEPGDTARQGASLPAGDQRVSLAQLRFAPPPAPVRRDAPVAPPARSQDIVTKPLFMPRSSSEPERASRERRTLTENLTAVSLSDVNNAIDLFGRLVTSRTMIARGVQVLQVPATESARNSQRLRGIIDRLASEFEVVRRERRMTSQDEGWDPVELETFDTYTQIMLELGEIIADQDEIADTLQEGVRRTSVICETDQESTEQLQRALLGFRLVRLHEMEPRLEQVVSSTSRMLGRKVDWRLRGGSIALDKAVLDAVQEPLLHLLRNSIDHGIETPEQRKAAGKPETGTITVEAAYGTNNVVIRVVDDGAGIDPERIAAVAVQRGLVTAEAVAAMDRRAKLDLIWKPGFSTASTVTDISGRGVGLDIVQSALARVRGSATVQTTLGRGTTFSLSLPLSLSVARTLVLRDGKATVAVPIAQIEGVHLVDRKDITNLSDRVVVSIEGRTITLLPQGLGRNAPLEERLSGDTVTILEVRVRFDRTIGFFIDEVLGEEDTLVKALPSYLSHNTSFVGCSVAGDGRPYAILDLRRLADATGLTGIPSISTSTAQYAYPLGQLTKPLALIVDDSLFMRRSLTDVYADAGFKVETAEDGEAALAAIARSGMPDLISLDMEMPRMNGLEMLSILRQLPGGQHVPVFMITTRGQERHRTAAIRAGVTRYFIKPFSSDELIRAAQDECRIPLTSNIA